MQLAAATIIAAVGLSAAPPASAADDDALRKDHRVYHGQSIPLLRDPSRLAVQSTDPAALAVALRAAGLDPAKMDAAAIPGWWLVPTAGADVDRTISTLITLPSVDFASPVYFDSLGGPMWMTRDIMVGPSAGTQPAAIDRALTIGIAARRELMPGIELVTTTSRSGVEVLNAANRLAADKAFLFAEPDAIFTGHSDLIPTDPLFSGQWEHNNTGQSGGTVNQDMDAPDAWDITTGSPSIIVVVLDVGTDLTHPDLNLAPGADFTGAATLGAPGNVCDKHGTAVAGCISAKINNGLGVVGIAPAVRTAPARCFISTIPTCNGSWNSSASWTVNALNWAQTIGARVTNNSNGYGFTSSAVEAAYASTYAANIVHFASNGNSGTGTIGYPASVPFVNGVAALNRNGGRASFSQYGPGTDFSAPGQSVSSIDIQASGGYNSGDYVTVDGTSFASPFSAGVAALVLSRNPTLTSSRVELIMQGSCRDLGTAGYDTGFGWGFVNAKSALIATSLCVADFDDNGTIALADVFGFLNGWFAGDPRCKVTGALTLELADVFGFLNHWFAGC